LFGKIPRTVQELEICGVVNIAITQTAEGGPFLHSLLMRN